MITFKQTEDTEILILRDGMYIGRIFTPAGTLCDNPKGIQVCGFDTIKDLWGCGRFNDGIIPKLDVTLEFSGKTSNKILDYDWIHGCPRCFMPIGKCRCKEILKQMEDMADTFKKELILKKIEQDE